MKKCIILVNLLINCCIVIFAGFTPEAQFPEDVILNGDISSIKTYSNDSKGDSSYSAQYFFNNQLVKKEFVNMGIPVKVELYSNGLLIHRKDDYKLDKDFRYKIDFNGNEITQYRDKHNKTLLIYKNNRLVEKKFYERSENKQEWYNSGSPVKYEYDTYGRISEQYNLSSDGVEYLKLLYFYDVTDKERVDQLLRDDVKILKAHILTSDSIPILTKIQRYPFAEEKEGPLTDKELLSLETETIEFNDKGLPIIHSFYKSINPKPYIVFSYEYEYDEKGNWIKFVIKKKTDDYYNPEHDSYSREILYYD